MKQDEPYPRESFEVYYNHVDLRSKRRIDRETELNNIDLAQQMLREIGVKL